MAGPRFMWNNLIDTATITSSSEDSILVDDNVANALRSKPWKTGNQSPSVVAEWIKFDLGSAQNANCFVILDHDFTATDTLVLEANSSDAWGPSPQPPFTQALTHNAGPIVVYFDQSPLNNYRYWRLNITKDTATETRQIGRIFLGTYDTGVNTGLKINATDTSLMSRSIGGQTYSDIRPSYDSIMIEMGVVSKAIMDNFNTMFDTVGTHTPFFVSVDNDVEPNDWLYYAKAKSLPNYQAVIGTSYWQSSLNLEEQL